MPALALNPPRHSFLARLPAHVRLPLEDKVAAITGQDLRDFALAYLACFLAVTTYFA
jgi:hypothetical protein